MEKFPSFPNEEDFLPFSLVARANRSPVTRNTLLLVLLCFLKECTGCLGNIYSQELIIISSMGKPVEFCGDLSQCKSLLTSQY